MLAGAEVASILVCYGNILALFRSSRAGFFPKRAGDGEPLNHGAHCDSAEKISLVTRSSYSGVRGRRRSSLRGKDVQESEAERTAVIKQSPKCLEAMNGTGCVCLAGFGQPPQSL